LSDESVCEDDEFSQDCGEDDSVVLALRLEALLEFLEVRPVPPALVGPVDP